MRSTVHWRCLLSVYNVCIKVAVVKVCRRCIVVTGITIDEKTNEMPPTLKIMFVCHSMKSLELSGHRQSASEIAFIRQISNNRE